MEFLNILIAILVIVVAMVVGTILEKNHFSRIRQREGSLQHIPTLNVKRYPTDRVVMEARMVSGSVVVSVDHFKRFLAGLRNIFGGEVRSYCSLLDRGRREALLRMKEKMPHADLYINVRVETSSISKGERKTIGSTEVLAYCTAIKFAS